MLFYGYVVGEQEANCYVVGDEESREALLIDPGDNASALLKQFREHDLRITAVFATHHHLDHTGGLDEILKGLPEARFFMHHLDYDRIAEQMSRASTRTSRQLTPPRAPDRFIDHGDHIKVGRKTFTALHCPGHTPGSLCLYSDRTDRSDIPSSTSEMGMVFTGDVLFAGAIGRSDLRDGDGPTLIRSIYQHLLTLPAETMVFPGHNEATTIGSELSLNPFLRDPDLVPDFDS